MLFSSSPKHVLRAPGLLLVMLLPFSLACAPSSAQPDTAPLAWPHFNEALASAQQSGKKVLIDIYSDHCGWCRRMQAEVYSQPDVRRYLSEHFELGRVYIDNYSDTLSFKGYNLTQAELAMGLGATGTPTTVFLEPSGDYITRLPGYHNTEGFMSVLRFIGTESFRDQSYQEFKEAQEQ